jgi:hypothetical protein
MNSGIKYELAVCHEALGETMPARQLYSEIMTAEQIQRYSCPYFTALTVEKAAPHDVHPCHARQIRLVRYKWNPAAVAVCESTAESPTKSFLGFIRTNKNPVQRIGVRFRNDALAAVMTKLK